MIKSAKFVISNTDVSKCPNSELPEYAFIGRSNVGKSSLINMLTGVKNLAMTSSKPGKTLLMNHFIINDVWHLVDLPGYGYARIGKQGRERLEEMIRNYIIRREQLTNLFVLIDSRHEPQQIDIEFITWLGEQCIPFSIIFTKSDKISKSALQTNVTQYQNKLFEIWEELPPIFITSAEKGLGREEVLGYIRDINASL
ncbi:MAG: YihA family ribosome biogenesis GTP-binding protein [Paludibacteraceae bacterium]|nr:YihA family ribosome biogenesis GTP-binding protein [Paludibacteraceae bacterium]MBP6284910.1 YihA family ribosome biogenesis GTP-binding protein [Paludibacteraceae bacterium]